MTAGAIDSTRASVRIGLLGMYASANLGDTAIQLAVMQGLHSRRPGVSFVALCPDPHDAMRTFGLEAHDSSGSGATCLHDAAPTKDLAWLRRLEEACLPVGLAAAAWRIDRLMRTLDMLIVSGSGQVDDFWGGPWVQPFRLAAWTSSARRQRKPIATFGIGVDDISTRTGALLCIGALERAQFRGVRDAGSLKALRDMRLMSAVRVHPDPAFYLTARTGDVQGAGGFVVLSPISRRAWNGDEDAAYERYLDALAHLADGLQRRGIEVRFVCSQTRMDPPVIERIRLRMQTDSQAPRWIPVGSVEDYLVAVAPARLVVASRLHALILALVAGAPVVALSYAPKVRRQMQDVELDRWCFDLADIRSESLSQRVDEALAAQALLRSHVHKVVVRLRHELSSAFDSLAGLAPTGSLAEAGKPSEAR